MPPQVRRQHTLSKFYLRGFADEYSRVKRSGLSNEAGIRLSINDASVIKDYYTVSMPDGSTSDLFEHAFAEIEGPAGAALSEVRRGTWPLSPQGKSHLAAWIALQYLRGEEIRAGQRYMHGEIIRLLVGVSGKEALRRHISEAEGRPVSDQELHREWLDLTKPGGPDLKASPEEHMRLFVELWPKMTAYLSDTHWTLYRVSQGELVTSDHPVTMAKQSDGPFDPPGVGIATADLFCIPLTRNLALVAQPRRRLNRYGPGAASSPDFQVSVTKEYVDSFNQQTVMYARRYLYMHPGASLDERIAFPEPDGDSRLQASDVEGLISERGLFADGPVSAAPASSARRSERGMSLSNLPWPLPGRVRPPMEA